MRRLLQSGGCVLTLLVAGSTASADLISLPAAPYLFEDTSPLRVSYKYRSLEAGLLQVASVGNTRIYVTDEGGQNVYRGSFSLEAFIDPTNEEAISVAFLVTADVDDNPKTKDVMLWQSSQVTAFGFAPDFSLIQFELVQEGDSWLTLIKDRARIGVVLRSSGLVPESENPSHDFTPSWQASFRGRDVSSRADEFLVAHAPLPGAAWGGLGLLGAVAVMHLRRQRAE